MKTYFTKKQNKVILIAALLIIVIGGILLFTYINPPKDNIAAKVLPEEYFCDIGESYIDYQTAGNCAAYAAAYVLRCLGEQTDGEVIEPEMQRIFGFVPANSIVNVFENHEFIAEAYCGNIDSLKQRLTEGVPVIAFVDIPGDTHYVVVVGYDRQYIYLADSLEADKNAEGNCYNRKLETAEFERIWRTATILTDNIYIAARRPDSSM